MKLLNNVDSYMLKYNDACYTSIMPLNFSLSCIKVVEFDFFMVTSNEYLMWLVLRYATFPLIKYDLMVFLGNTSNVPCWFMLCLWFSYIDEMSYFDFNV